MTSSPPGRSAALLYFLTLVYVGVLVSSLGPSLPALAERTGSTLGSMSILFSMRALGFLLGCPLYGRLLDRFPGHRVMAVSALLTGVSVASIGLAPALGILMLFSFIYGLCESGLDMGANTLLTWVYGEHVAPFMNALHFFFGVGALAGPLLVVGILNSGGGVTGVYGAMALMALPLLAVLWSTPSPPRTVATSTSALQKKSTDKQTLYLLFLMFFLYVGAEVALSGWIFTIGLRSGGLSDSEAGALTSLFWGVFTCARLAAVLVARKARTHRILWAALSGVVVTASAGVVLPLRDGFLVTLTFAFGVFMASVFPMMMSLASGLVTMSARVTSLFLVAAGVGSMLLPWIFGWLLDSVGMSAAWLILVADLMLTLVVFALLMRRVSQLSVSPSTPIQ